MGTRKTYMDTKYKDTKYKDTKFMKTERERETDA